MKPPIDIAGRSGAGREPPVARVDASGGPRVSASEYSHAATRSAHRPAPGVGPYHRRVAPAPQCAERRCALESPIRSLPPQTVRSTRHCPRPHEVKVEGNVRDIRQPFFQAGDPRTYIESVSA